MDEKLEKAKLLLQERKASLEASEIVGNTLVHVENGVKNYYVPDNIVTIENNAFSDVESLEKLYITQSVQYVSAQAVKDLPNFQGAFVSDKNPYLLGYDGCIYSKDVSKLIYFRPNAKPNIPSKVTSLGEYSFYNCKAYALTLPEGVTEIGAYAFCNADIATIVLSKSITDIPPHCFENCAELEEVFAPPLNSIGDYAFSGCVHLKKLPYDGAKTIGERAFARCELFTSLNLWQDLTLSPYCFADMNALVSVELPDEITELPEGCFYGCVKLAKINLEKLEHISDYCFFNCFDLSYFYLGLQLKSIGCWAFANNKQIKKLIIPNNVEFLGADCFANLAALTELSTPFMSKTLGSDIEQSLTYLLNTVPRSLNTLILTNGLKRLSSKALHGSEYLINLTLPTSLEIIENQALFGLNCLQNITLPFIGESREKPMPLSFFFGMVPRSLYHITVSEGAKLIAKNCFKDLINVEQISLPLSLIEIGKGAFENCKSLQKILFPLKTELKIPKSALKGCSRLDKSFPVGVKISLF